MTKYQIIESWFKGTVFTKRNVEKKHVIFIENGLCFQTSKILYFAENLCDKGLAAMACV